MQIVQLVELAAEQTVSRGVGLVIRWHLVTSQGGCQQGLPLLTSIALLIAPQRALTCGAIGDGAA